MRDTPSRMRPTHPAAGEKRRGQDSRRAGELDRRQGRAYARIAPRPMIEVLTGISTTSVHLRAHGERRLSLAELDRLARSPDPQVNPLHPIAEALSVVEGARRSLPLEQLLPSIVQRSTDEQRADGAEDVSQMELVAAVELLRQKGLVKLSYVERERVRKAVIAHHAAAVRHLATEMAFVADLEALALHVEERH